MQTSGSHDVVGLLRAVLREPNPRAVVVGWGLSVVAETSALVALLVIAFDVGGPGLVGAFAALRAAPALIAGPVLIGRSDRGRRERWLVAVLTCRVALLAAAAVSLALDGAIAALVLGGLASVLFTTHRPMNAALLPYLTRTPEQLTASNAAIAFMEGAGTLLGPALAGALLLSASPTAVLVASALLMAGAAVMALGISAVARSGSYSAPLTLRTAVSDLGEGFAVLRRPAFILALSAAQTFARGVLLVAVTVLALDLFELGDPGVGWLSAMLGVGGLVGSLLAGALITSTRLARGFASGVALWGLPMLVLGLATTPAVGFLAFAVIGLGNAAVDIGVFTLVARLVPPALIGRAFAAFEVTIIASVTAGAWFAGVVVPVVGVRPMLVVVGVALVLGAVAFARATARVDEALVPGEHVETLRACRPLAGLPTISVDHLACVAHDRHYAAGAVVMRQGETGDSFHVVVDGSADVLVDGEQVARLRPGDGFGEIALLRDVPRTATVVAQAPLHTVAVDRASFQTFVAGHPSSATAVGSLADARLRSNANRDR